MILSYDIAKMRDLLRSFYTLTEIRIVIFNDECVKIAEYPDSDCSFCSLIRTNAEAEKKCRAYDRFACEKCKQTNSIYSYICHAGLTETVAPIRYGNIIIGYLMFGQVLQAVDLIDYWSTVWEHCSAYGVDMEKLREAYFQKKPIEMRQLYASALILEACAGYLWLQRYISLQEDSLPKQIDEYINSHLNDDLSISALCRQFRISRSKLYKIAGEYFGKSVDRLTRQLRIDRAKEILENTDDSVSEVSSQVGFNDYNYFIKVFKKETGMTPKQYGKLMKRW